MRAAAAETIRIKIARSQHRKVATSQDRKVARLQADNGAAIGMHNARGKGRQEQIKSLEKEILQKGSHQSALQDNLAEREIRGFRGVP